MAGGVHACYYHKINEALQVGAELEGSLRTQEATTTIAYQLDLPATNLSFKGKFRVNSVSPKKIWSISSIRVSDNIKSGIYYIIYCI